MGRIQTVQSSRIQSKKNQGSARSKVRVKNETRNWRTRPTLKSEAVEGNLPHTAQWGGDGDKITEVFFWGIFRVFLRIF
jgi:hypothetical protein